jgi:hypothetical protein
VLTSPRVGKCATKPMRAPCFLKNPLAAALL